jgi:hypothetical protein
MYVCICMYVYYRANCWHIKFAAAKGTIYEGENMFIIYMHIDEFMYTYIYIYIYV